MSGDGWGSEVVAHPAMRQMTAPIVIDTIAPVDSAQLDVAVPPGSVGDVMDPTVDKNFPYVGNLAR